MATKQDAFEESTKIHSSQELDQILRSARIRPALADVDEPNLDQFEERTRIGPVEEIAAQLRVPEEPAPAPRASAKNIVRRTGPVAVVRASEPMPIPRMATGSTPPANEPADEFASWSEWDDAPKLDAPPVVAEPEPVVEAAPAIEAPVIEAPAYVEPAPIAETIAPVTPEAAPRRMRWGVLAWCALLVVAIVGGSLAYMRIADLEQQLADANAKLERR